MLNRPVRIRLKLYANTEMPNNLNQIWWVLEL